MSILVFGNGDLEKLREQLLKDSPNEAAAVLLAGRTNDGGEPRLFVREFHGVPHDQYQVQEPFQCVIRPSFLAPLLKRARIEGFSLILAHSHPFSHLPSFSDMDDAGERVLMPCLFSRASDRPHGSLVLGRVGCTARLWATPHYGPKDVEAIIESGRDLRIHAERGMAEDSLALDFDRSVRAFGKEGQRTLASLTVSIVGLGGLGSIVAEQLAHLGVERFLLLDPDAIEQTNLNRVVGATRDTISRAKVKVARALIRRVRPGAMVTAIRGNVTISEDVRRLLGSHVIFCCTDTHGSRAVLNQVAYQYMIPVFDLGVRVQLSGRAVESITGRVQMLAPGLPCLVCQNLLDPEEVRRDLLTDEERERDPYIVGVNEPQPAVISLNGTVASFGVTMMLSAVTGLPDTARHQVILFDRGVARAVDSTREKNCVVCSLRGMLARGDLWPAPGRPKP